RTCRRRMECALHDQPHRRVSDDCRAANRFRHVNPPREIEIIGGGLAGLSLGLALRRADVPVTLYEAGTYPRHRVCGEFITGLGVSTIARLGLESFVRDALRHHDVAWHLGEDAPRIQKLPSPALGISRWALDARLAEAFVRSG